MTHDFNSLYFGIDLIDATICELDFLSKIDKIKYLYDSNMVNEALRRYEMLWLPLVKDYSGIVVAPIDIYWVWHVHMLSPVAYSSDLKNKIGKVLDHKFLEKKIYDTALNVFKEWWHERYSDEPFDISENSHSKLFVSNFSYDIQSATIRQSALYYQVSLPHYSNKKFLERSLVRYKMFLTLRRDFPEHVLAPCYDIDIIWHTHQLHPLVYNADTVRILGAILPHDDSINDRSPDSQLTLSDNATRNLWLKTFKEPYANSGSMFRGDSCIGRLNDIDPACLFSIWPKIINLEMTFFSDTTGIWKYILKIYLMSINKGDECVFKYDYQTKKMKSKYSILNFSTSLNVGFRIKLFRKTSLCSKKLRFISEFRTYQDFESFTPAVVRSTFSYKIDILLNKKMFDTITMNFTPQSINGSNTFYGSVNVGEFISVLLNKTNPYIFGLILTAQSESSSVTGMMASHNLQTIGGKHAFDVNVIHSIELSQSMVLVYSDDKLLTVAHLIGKEQLPIVEKIYNENKYPMLNNKDGQRAMLIKDNKGDWAIIIANWHVSLDSKESSGYLDMELFYLRDNNRYIHLEINIFKDVLFNIDDVVANMATGEIKLLSSDKKMELPNYACTIFVISVLYVLCKPRMIAGNLQPDGKESNCNLQVGAEIIPNQPVNLTTKHSIKDRPHVYQSPRDGTSKMCKDLCASAKLLIASGYNLSRHIPSNSFLKQWVDPGGCAGCVGYSNKSFVKESTADTGIVCDANISRFYCESETDNESVDWD